MSRQVQLVFALAGLWGGAFAWNRAAMPQQERVAQLTNTGATRNAPQRALVWPQAVPLAAADRRVARDLFAVRVAEASTPAPAQSPVGTPLPVAPPFRYVGFVADGAGRKVLLSTPEGVRAVAEGDLLTGGWILQRVEAERIVVRDAVSGSESIVPRDR